MISAPLRVSAPNTAAFAGAPFRLGASPASSSSSSSGRSNIRCAAPPAAAAAAAATCSASAPATLYEVLGLRAGATAREIKAAYRRLARERHPDVAPGAVAAADFVRLHHAYATLSDPDTRARYDRGALVAAAVAQRPRWGAGAARPRRTWETDQCW